MHFVIGTLFLYSHLSSTVAAQTEPKASRGTRSVKFQTPDMPCHYLLIWSLAGPDCRLKEAGNFSRIPNLLLKVREHCLGKLTTALEENASVLATLSRASCTASPQDKAVEMEYAVFCSTKTVQVYKLTVHRKVRFTVLSYNNIHVLTYY